MSGSISRKTPQQFQWLKESILKNPVLHDLSLVGSLVDHLSEHVNAMINVAYKQHYKYNDVIMREGDMFATECFLIESGTFDFHMDPSLNMSSDHDRLMQE